MSIPDRIAGATVYGASSLLGVRDTLVLGKPKAEKKVANVFFHSVGAFLSLVTPVAARVSSWGYDENPTKHHRMSKGERRDAGYLGGAASLLAVDIPLYITGASLGSAYLHNPVLGLLLASAAERLALAIPVAIMDEKRQPFFASRRK